MKMKAYREN